MVNYRLNSHYKYWTLITLYNKVHKSLQVFSDFRDALPTFDRHVTRYAARSSAEQSPLYPSTSTDTRPYRLPPDSHTLAVIESRPFIRTACSGS